MSTESIKKVFVDVYCLVKLTDAQQAAYVREFEKDERYVEFVHPNFVPWTEERDGDLKDLYRLYEEKKVGIWSFFFFIDRQCLSNKSIIIAQMDEFIMINSEEALKTFNEYLAKYPIEGLEEIHGPLLEPFYGEVAKRGLTFGRVPATEFRSVWANLDIANMGMNELVGFCGGKEVPEGCGVVELIPNPEWDPEAFMRQLGECLSPEAKL